MLTHSLILKVEGTGEKLRNTVTETRNYGHKYETGTRNHRDWVSPFPCRNPISSERIIRTIIVSP